jgi:hypothetical protein
MIKKITPPFSLVLILAALTGLNFLFAANSVRGFSALVESWRVNPIIFLILFLVFTLVFRFIKQTDLPRVVFNTYIYIMIPLLTISAVVLTYIEVTNYTNFLYSRYFIYFDRITLWAMATWFLALAFIPKNVWYKHWQNIVFILPVIFLFGMSLIWMWPQDIFLQLVKEDYLIENAQVVVLVLAGLLALLQAKDFYRKHFNFLTSLFLVASIALFFIAGDEISWGQRLFGFVTPVEFAAENLQNETTVHNLDGIHQAIGYGYLLVGLFGAFGWIVADNFLKKYQHWTKYFVPPAYLFFFFYLSLVYNAYALGGLNNFKEWSEVAELFLYSGVFGFLLINFLSNSKNLK